MTPLEILSRICGCKNCKEQCPCDNIVGVFTGSMVHLTGDLWSKSSFPDQVYLCIESCLAFCKGDEAHPLSKSAHQLLARLIETWGEEADVAREAEAECQRAVSAALEEFRVRNEKIQGMKPWTLDESSTQFQDWRVLCEMSSHFFLETKAVAERVCGQALKTAKADTASRVKALLQ